MSRFSKFSKILTAKSRTFEQQQEVNFMAGISYKVNPLSTLIASVGSKL